MNDKNERMLLIVDPQIDFINGSLPVPGAEEAMNALARYVEDHGDEYRYIFITCDNHPLNHLSFKESGGKWPTHCVMSSVGAAIWPPLMEALLRRPKQVEILYKGDNNLEEEYSIFRNENGSRRLYVTLMVDQIKEVDICGLAGDVCVAQTLEDGQRLYPHIHFHILKEFTAYLG